MKQKEIRVPQGMLSAGRAVYSRYFTAEEGTPRILKAALCWLDIELEKLQCAPGRWEDGVKAVRSMFLAPEPEVPEEDREYQQQLEKFCGDGSPEMKAGFQRGWLAAYHAQQQKSEESHG